MPLTDHYSDSDFHKDTATGFRWALWLAVLLIGLIILVSTMWVFGFGFFQRETAAFRGETGAIEKRESAENRIVKQEMFEDLYQEIKATDLKLTAAKAKVDASPDSQVALTEYTGLINHCIDAVADYNAEARKYTSAQFRAADLPEEIDTNDSTTDCKEG